MKLCVLIIVSGLMCLGACKMTDFMVDRLDESLLSYLGVLLFAALGIISGVVCFAGAFHGILLAVAFLGV